MNRLMNIKFVPIQLQGPNSNLSYQILVRLAATQRLKEEGQFYFLDNELFLKMLETIDLQPIAE